MKWNSDKSAQLTQICLIILSVCHLALDIGAWPLCRWFGGLRGISPVPLCIVIYGVSLWAWPVIWHLWRLLANIRREQVFIKENYMHLFHVSWCLVGAAAVCAVGGFFYYPLFLPAVAAGFMAIILRVLKNVFQEAVEMRSELDLTV